MREFRKTTGRNARPQVWKIGIDKNDPKIYVIQWGLLDGLMQETRDIPGSCGVKGHSDYQTEEQYAIFCMEREIRKKLEKGYIEFIDGKPTGKVSEIIDFNKQLPKNLCFYKPKKEISEKKLKELENKNHLIWTLKRDGMMHIIVISNSISIYSRRMDIVTDKYPHIIKAVKLLNLPNNTILLGEMVIDKNGKDNFRNVSKICRSDKELCLAYQGLGDFPKGKETNIIGKLSYYVYDIPFYNGIDLVSNEPVGKRLSLIRKIFSPIVNLTVNTGIKVNKKQLFYDNKLRDELISKYNIGPLKIFRTNSNSDIQLAKELKVEGFVVIDIYSKYNDKAYSFDGKEQRPEGIWKRKPKFEEEFIISGIYSGSGRNRDKLGGFEIEQYLSNGLKINCGKCGGGFKDDQRCDFWKQRDSLIGKTIKIEFDSRQPPRDGTYALRFPEFKGFSDKKPEECIAQYL